MSPLGSCLERLTAILAEYPEGIKEYLLLQRLAEDGWLGFEDTPHHDHLGLFRRHFALFHLLYLLRDRLRSEELGDLHIHCMRIQWLPHRDDEPAVSAQSKSAPMKRDNLRAYYLDLSNLEQTTEEDVNAMLAGFWKRYDKASNKTEALETLGLAEDASRDVIKQRFRSLVKEHHPDVGGDAERFREIKEAAEGLLAK